MTRHNRSTVQGLGFSCRCGWRPNSCRL